VSAELGLRLPSDPLLTEELIVEDVVEMANLTSAQTGVSGTIFISSAMGAHGPRVKYFVQPGRMQPSFSVSIADAPIVVANSLPARTVRQMAPPGYRLGRLEPRCTVGFLATRRYLDAARGQRFHPAPSLGMSRG
jgi:hypothetical protein